MVFLILAALGVPLWLCAVGIVTVVVRNRALRGRPGNVSVRVLRPGKKRWVRGHGIWVHDIFVFRGSPAAWKEELVWVSDVSLRVPSPEERDGWRQLGDDPIVAVLQPNERTDSTIEVAARGEHRDLLAGPFTAPATP
jgi:hypothetical protein